MTTYSVLAELFTDAVCLDDGLHQLITATSRSTIISGRGSGGSEYVIIGSTGDKLIPQTTQARQECEP